MLESLFKIEAICSMCERRSACMAMSHGGSMPLFSCQRCWTEALELGLRAKFCLKKATLQEGKEVVLVAGTVSSICKKSNAVEVGIHRKSGRFFSGWADDTNVMREVTK